LGKLGLVLPDVCAPDCDGAGQCPPNFVCSSKAFTFLKDPFCLPAMPGFPCSQDADCLAGTCQTVDDLKVCAPNCSTDANCKAYAHDTFSFVCQAGRCVSPSSFVLRFCDTQDPNACQPGYHCQNLLVFNICLQNCTNDSDCPQAQVPQTCTFNSCIPTILN